MGSVSCVHVPVGNALGEEGLLVSEMFEEGRYLRLDWGVSCFCLFLFRAHDQLQTPVTGPEGQSGGFERTLAQLRAAFCIPALAPLDTNVS